MGLSGLGIVTLFQSFCIIIGTNIASSINVLWVAFQNINIVGFFGLLTLVGVVIRLFVKNNTAKNWGMCLCGFGLIFVGLSFMSSSVKELSTSPEFIKIFFSLDHPAILFLLGLVFSALINSALGTVAVLSSILTTTPELLSIQNVAYVVYAMNIGTCFMVLVIALTSGNRQSVKTGLSHLIFNVIGAIIFSLLTLLDWVTPVTSFLNNPTLQIIFINIIFNVVTAIVVLPLAKPISKLLDTLIKEKETSAVKEISKMPTLGLVQLESNAVTYFNETCSNLTVAMNFVASNDELDLEKTKAEIVSLSEQAIDTNNQLLRLGSELLAGDESIKRSLNNTFIGIEKSNVNILKLINSCFFNTKKVNFTQKQLKTILDLQEIMEENILDMQNVITEIYTKGDLASKEQLNNILDRLEKVTQLKLEAKKSIFQDSFSLETKIKKYTCYLNVINYFEQINTNLTDIILNTANIRTDAQVEIIEEITVTEE